jgi:hypothetical protein
MDRHWRGPVGEADIAVHIGRLAQSERSSAFYADQARRSMVKTDESFR